MYIPKHISFPIGQKSIYELSPKRGTKTKHCFAKNAAATISSGEVFGDDTPGEKIWSSTTLCESLLPKLLSN